jgi:hypothetical protein
MAITENDVRVGCVLFVGRRLSWLLHHYLQDGIDARHKHLLLLFPDNPLPALRVCTRIQWLRQLCPHLHH